MITSKREYSSPQLKLSSNLITRLFQLHVTRTIERNKCPVNKKEKSEMNEALLSISQYAAPQQCGKNSFEESASVVSLAAFPDTFGIASSRYHQQQQLNCATSVKKQYNNFCNHFVESTIEHKIPSYVAASEVPDVTNIIDVSDIQHLSKKKNTSAKTDSFTKIDLKYASASYANIPVPLICNNQNICDYETSNIAGKIIHPPIKSGEANCENQITVIPEDKTPGSEYKELKQISKIHSIDSPEILGRVARIRASIVIPLDQLQFNQEVRNEGINAVIRRKSMVTLKCSNLLQHKDDILSDRTDARKSFCVSEISKTRGRRKLHGRVDETNLNINLNKVSDPVDDLLADTHLDRAIMRKETRRRSPMKKRAVVTEFEVLESPLLMGIPIPLKVNNSITTKTNSEKQPRDLETSLLNVTSKMSVDMMTEMRITNAPNISNSKMYATNTNNTTNRRKSLFELIGSSTTYGHSTSTTSKKAIDSSKGSGRMDKLDKLDKLYQSCESGFRWDSLDASADSILPLFSTTSKLSPNISRNHSPISDSSLTSTTTLHLIDDTEGSPHTIELLDMERLVGDKDRHSYNQTQTRHKLAKSAKGRTLSKSIATEQTSHTASFFKSFYNVLSSNKSRAVDIGISTAVTNTVYDGLPSQHTANPYHESIAVEGKLIQKTALDNSSSDAELPRPNTRLVDEVSGSLSYDKNANKGNSRPNAPRRRFSAQPSSSPAHDLVTSTEVVSRYESPPMSNCLHQSMCTPKDRNTEFFRRLATESKNQQQRHERALSPDEIHKIKEDEDHTRQQKRHIRRLSLALGSRSNPLAESPTRNVNIT